MSIYSSGYLVIENDAYKYLVSFKYLYTLKTSVPHRKPPSNKTETCPYMVLSNVAKYENFTT